MPHLIRLLHGNLYGIKKLVREFRVFWLRKCQQSSSADTSLLGDSDLDESFKQQKDMDTSDVGDALLGEALDTSKTTALLDKSCDGSEIVDKSQEEGHGCEISKRQLEKKIMSMAVREKRSALKKIAWYVHDAVLKEYDMIDIELPNTWEFLTFVPRPKSPANALLACSSLKLQQASSSLKLQQAPSIVDEENAAPDALVLPLYPPKDQRSIMDFALTKKELMSRADQMSSNSTPKDNAPATVCKSSENKGPSQSQSVVVNSGESSVDEKVEKKGGKAQRSIMDFAMSKKVDASHKICNINNTTDISIGSSAFKAKKTDSDSSPDAVKVCGDKMPREATAGVAASNKSISKSDEVKTDGRSLHSIMKFAKSPLTLSKGITTEDPICLDVDEDDENSTKKKSNCCEELTTNTTTTNSTVATTNTNTSITTSTANVEELIEPAKNSKRAECETIFEKSIDLSNSSIKEPVDVIIIDDESKDKE